MKRRICIVGAAIAATPFALWIGVLPAQAKKPTKPTKTAPAAKGTLLKCSISLNTAPPPGSATVAQPPSQGEQFGPIHCPPVGTYGPGVEADSFTVPASGDTVGSYAQYFNEGSIRGKFDLTPSEGVLSPTNFTGQSWTGTVTVTGGTGKYAGAKGTKGTLTCTSPDSVHLTCVEKIRLTSK